MNKLLVLYPGAEKYKSRIESLCAGRLEPVFLTEPIDPAVLQQLTKEAEAIIGDPDPATLTEQTCLKWLQLSWAGVAPFVPAAKAMGFTLTNSSGAFGVTIAEHVMGLLLALTRRLPAYLRNQERQLWQRAGSEWQLQGKRALILGAGDLGQAVAVRLQAFGVTTIGLCRNKGRQRSGFDGLISQGELEEQLPLADLIIGCLPGTDTTCGLLSRARLASCKKTAILINVGRGSVLDETALAELMQSGHFFGAGLDVFEKEPLPNDSPLWGLENVILTPHVAGIGFGHLPETEAAIWSIALDNLARYLEGEPLRNVVNPELGY